MYPSDSKPSQDCPPVSRLKGPLRRLLLPGGVLLLGIAALFFFTSVFQGTAPDLSVLPGDDDTWAVHLRHPEVLLDDPAAARLLENLLTEPAWRKLLGWQGGDVSPSLDTLRRMLQDWPVADVLLLVKWREPRQIPPLGNPISGPGDTLTLILRPVSSTPLAAARALFLPGLGPVLRRRLFHEEAGAEVFDGILTLANPRRVDQGLNSLGELNFATSRDVLIFSTSFEEVRRLRHLLEKTRSGAEAPSPLTLHLNSQGIEKMASMTRDLFGDGTLTLLQALSRPGAPSLGGLRIEGRLHSGIQLSTEFPGICWPPAPLPRSPGSDHEAVLALTPQEALRRLPRSFRKHFDAARQVRRAEELLAPDQRPLMTLQEWLTDEHLRRMEELAGHGDKVCGVNLAWLPPPRGGDRDVPVFVLSAPVDAAAAKAWGLKENVPGDWTPVPRRQLAGLNGHRSVHALFQDGHLFLASQNPGSFLPTVNSAAGPAPATPALWSLRTSGKNLASLLMALDRIRLEHIERPTLFRRRQVWQQFGHASMSDAELEKASDSFFRVNAGDMRKTLTARRDAWVALLSLLGPIEALALEREGRTRIQVTLGIQP